LKACHNNDIGFGNAHWNFMKHFYLFHDNQWNKVFFPFFWNTNDMMEKVFFLNAKNLWNCIKLNSKDSKAQSITIEPKKTNIIHYKMYKWIMNFYVVQVNHCHNFTIMIFKKLNLLEGFNIWFTFKRDFIIKHNK